MKKIKHTSCLDSNILNKYLEDNNMEEMKVFLPYDLQNMIFTKVIQIKKLEVKVHKIWLDNNNLIECNDCGRIWDGFAQCDCFLY